MSKPSNLNGGVDMTGHGESPIIDHTGGGAACPNRGRAAAWAAALAVILVALTVGFGPQPSYAASPTVANKTFTLFQGLSSSSIVPADVVVVQPYNSELSQDQISTLHSENKNTKVIRYVDTSESIDTVTALTDPRTWSLDYARRLNTDAEWNAIWSSHQSWLLKDSKGQYINRPASNSYEMNPKRAYLMDQGSAGWRDWLVNKVSQRLSYGYDGVFLDQCSPTPAGYSAIPAKYASNYGLWRNDVNGLINYIKSKFPKALIITNSIWQGQTYYANASPNPIDANNEDGTEIEGFVNGRGEGPTESEANWLKEVKIVKKLGDEGKMVLARAAIGASSADSPKKLLVYALATFLLGKSGSGAYFSFYAAKAETGFDSNYINGIYSLPLGEATGVYYQRDIAYRRDFTNGKVIVNPSDTKQSYTFTPLTANHYRDQDGNVYDASHRLVLPAKAGVILIAIQAFTPAGTRYEQTDTHIVRTGTWATFTRLEASGGTYDRSSTAGASATISFTGTKLNIIGMKGTTTGIMDVYLDSALKATVDTAAGTASYKLVLWSTGDLDQGTHTVRIVRNNASATGKFLTLDAGDVWGTIISVP